ncbi:ABC transporter substrate-binding protein [Phreatobacter oligotrophus]|uniref:Peptide/nickel transport system substrate-binding protein n=1 Tax=Phreatobacter oligotrophus TaxID=1122261 RepID=A0A2T4YS60_9HYPH|nr:ABC transporter substrate-binding protein [Phreatobacter oligotrophus]PTM46631.1 peptide/nickel transport system substrate-binding protein [Phreatobacter oligotrophus]
MLWVRWIVGFLLVFSSASLSTAEQKPRSGGAAIIAIQGDPGHFNPAISTAGPLHAVAGSLYNGLVALDRQGNPQPDLARSWMISQDGRTATFTLVNGVRWHDGQPFTSADVKFSFEEVLFRFHARARAGLASAVEAIETPDPQTVVFQLRRPHPALLRQLDVTEAPIIPRHVHQGTDVMQSPANLRPVGTGPFRFDSYQRDGQVVFVRNPNYFKPELPRLDRLIFRVIPDSATQVSAFLAGEIDMLARVSAIDAQRLRGQPITLVDTTSGAGGANCIMTLVFNLNRPALADLRVRRALTLAIDRQQILERVIFGQGRVAAAPIASGIGWAHQPGLLDGAQVDVVAANKLLDEAGLARGASGVRATLDILHFPAFARYSELMRQQLAAIGIALNMRQLDAAAFPTAVFSERAFDLALISYCNGVDPEIGVRRMYHSSAIGTVPFSNAAHIRDAEIDRLFDIAGSTGDTAVRGEAYRAAQRRIVELLPYWWLVETDFTAAWRNDLTGFSPWSGQFAETAWRLR